MGLQLSVPGITTASTLIEDPTDPVSTGPILGNRRQDIDNVSLSEPSRHLNDRQSMVGTGANALPLGNSLMNRLVQTPLCEPLRTNVGTGANRLPLGVARMNRLVPGQREPLRFDLIQLRAQRTAHILNGDGEPIDRNRYPIQ